MDIGKVWQTCKTQKNTVLAETKEAVSARCALYQIINIEKSASKNYDIKLILNNRQSILIDDLFFRYHTNTRLNTLRKAANAMFKRDDVTKVLSRTNLYIVKGTLCIRSDRNLHRDIGRFNNFFICSYIFDYKLQSLFF